MGASKLAEQPLGPEPVVIRHTRKTVSSKTTPKPSFMPQVGKKFGLIAGAGILFGLVMATLFQLTAHTSRPSPREIRSERPYNQPAPVIPVSTMVNAPKAANEAGENSDEIQRLKTRNRRLEALVEVLKKRTKHGKHNRHSTSNK